MVWKLQPHISERMTGVSGSQPLNDGTRLSVGVRSAQRCDATRDSRREEDEEDGAAIIVVATSPSAEVELFVSEVLAARLLTSGNTALDPRQQFLVTSEALDDASECDAVIAGMSTERCSGSSSSSSSSSSNVNSKRAQEASTKVTKNKHKETNKTKQNPLLLI